MKQNPLAEYFHESWLELKKVTWPTKNQAIKLTIITLVFTFASAFILTFFDFAFHYGYEYLLTLAQNL